MITAMNEKNQLVQLTKWSQKEELKKLRERHRFYCPACKGQLLLKIGEVTIPHFAHFKNKHCSVFSEGEGRLHIKGKILLYNWFKAQGIPVRLEPYLARIKQRPDLLLKIKNTYKAIEFQYSPISSTKVLQRTRGYTSLKIETIWIAHWGSPFFTGIQKMKINQFYDQFIQDNMLVTFDVSAKRFNKSIKLFHIIGQQFFTYNESTLLAFTNYPFKRISGNEVNRQILTEMWFEERQRVLKNRLRFNKRGLKDAFFQYCYVHRIALLDLPNWIGLPSKHKGNYHSAEWQLVIVLLLKEYEEDRVYDIFYRRFYFYSVPREVIGQYIRFLKRVNSKLEWTDIKNSSIYEEIFANMLH